MDLNEFQKKSLDTSDVSKIGDQAMDPAYYAALAICGEAGELANMMKKNWRGDPGAQNMEAYLAIRLEVGDIMWYVAVFADQMGWDLEEVAQVLFEKLAERAKQKRRGQ